MPDPRPTHVARPCPICARPASARERPFCSPRCAEIDLGRWLTGVYRLPGEALTDLHDEAEMQDPDGKPG